MKKWSLCFGVCILMMLMVGCQRNMDFVSLGVSIEDFVSKGKVYVDEDRYACWMNGDSVNINGEGYTVEVDGNGSKIEQVKWNESGYTAVYPAEYTKAVATDNVVINGPNSYQYRPKNVEGVDKQVLLNPMVARMNASEEGTLMFRNVGALVGVKLKNNDASAAITIDKIQLQATKAEAKLSGEATITNIDGAESFIAITGGGDNMVLWGINKEIANTEDDIFYMSIPPVSTEGNQFKVRVIFHVGEQYYEFNRTTSTIAGTIGRNQLGIIPINLTTTEDEYIKKSNGLMGEGKSGNPYIIADNGDLTRLKNFCNTSSTNQLYVQQVADLACSSDWMGIGTKNGNVIYAFKGHYDGGGFSVNMNNSPSGLFNYIGDNTEIKNLTITGTISANSSQYIGGIANIANGVKTSLKISNCVNKATINQNGALNHSRYLGGICGKIVGTGNVVIENCINKANIEGKVDESVTNNNFVYIGGLVGCCWSTNLNIPNCSNSGELKFLSGNIYKIGGIIGSCHSGLDMKQCVNNGLLIGNSSQSTSDLRCVGGLVGELNSENDLKLNECVNHGKIQNGYCTGGLVGYVYFANLCDIQDCYADNKFQGCKTVGGFVDSCYLVNGTLKIRNCYVDVSFLDCTTNIRLLVRYLNNTKSKELDRVYIPQNAVCGIGDALPLDNVSSITDSLVFYLNNSRDIWEKTTDGKVRLKFEGMGN